MPCDDPIQINAAEVAFGSRKVLDGLTVSIKRGELFVIIGPSGTGKSVTLKCISGQQPPTAGTVSLFNQDLYALNDKALAETRRKMGYLFQSGALLGWKTLFENVALPLIERDKLSPKEIDARVQNALNEVGLEHAGERYPSEVSGGMVKRAAFARAIIEDPEILLFDEPTSGLDPVMSRVIDQLILSICKSHKVTCIVVTHDLAGALQYADRIGFLNAGKFVEIATPAELVKSPVPEVQAFLNAQFVGGHYGK